MKSVLSNNCCEKKEKPFPKLMKHSTYGSIYLMRTVYKGTTIYAGKGSPNIIGDHFNDMSPSNLTDYEGDVCLTND